MDAKGQHGQLWGQNVNVVILLTGEKRKKNHVSLLTLLLGSCYQTYDGKFHVECRIMLYIIWATVLFIFADQVTE